MTVEQEKFLEENYLKVYEIYEDRHPEIIHSDFYLEDDADLEEVAEIIEELKEKIEMPNFKGTLKELDEALKFRKED